MRLWSLHPAFLDSKGLVAVWREGLLARAVLRGTTRGYRRHPQLIRFSAHPAPVSAINNYLRGIARESAARGYRFDRTLVGPVRNATSIPVTRGQLEFEWSHLVAKLRRRAPTQLDSLLAEPTIRPHPLFLVRDGRIESWEKGAPELSGLNQSPLQGPRQRETPSPPGPKRERLDTPRPTAEKRVDDHSR